MIYNYNDPDQVDRLKEQYDDYWAQEFPHERIREEDVVNNPSHYTSGKYEAIDVIGDATRDLEGIKAFASGNALKYIIRHNKKGKPVEDLEKAIFYIKRLIKSYEND
ncbi:MAG: DUF3310 domain-containing protein [Candidatus Marithrix sp.]